MKPQKSTLDFYLLASPSQDTRNAARQRWQSDSLLSLGYQKSRSSTSNHDPLNSLEGWSAEEGWVGLLQLVQHHCHIFVRQNKCLCKKNYTQVLMPTSYHPSKRENTSTLQQLGLCLMKWLDSSQWDNAHSPDILIYFRFFKSSTSERTYFRLFFDWEADELRALFHLTERRWKHLLSFRTIQRKHYTCE